MRTLLLGRGTRNLEETGFSPNIALVAALQLTKTVRDRTPTQ
ncbi:MULTISPECIES: hypothetical protein [unclassified Microcoleus]